MRENAECHHGFYRLSSFSTWKTTTPCSSILLFTMRKCGLALFQKGRHAFFLILRRKERLKESSFQSQTFLQTQLLRSIHGFFDHLDGLTPFFGNILGHGHDLIFQFFRRNHFSDQPGLFGGRGVHHFPRQTHVHGFGFANGAGESLGATGSGNDAQVDFGLAESGLVA